MRRRPLRALLPLALAAAPLLGACRGDEIAAPIDRVMVDVSTVLDAAQVPAVGDLRWNYGPQFNIIRVPVPSRCAYSGEAERFLCAPIDTNGVRFTYAYRLFDSSGRPQDALDPRTTAAVYISTTAAIEERGYQEAMDQTQELAVSGLLSRRILLNGTMVTRGLARSPGAIAGAVHASTVTTTFTDVALSATHEPPASGTVTVESVYDRPGPGSREHMKMMFDGSCTVRTMWTVWYIPTARMEESPGRVKLYRQSGASCPEAPGWRPGGPLPAPGTFPAKP